MREHTCNSQECSLWYHAFTLNGRQFQTVVVADVRKVDRSIMGRVPKDRVAVCEGVGARRGAVHACVVQSILRVKRHATTR
jgi:hypothetical protein